MQLRTLVIAPVSVLVTAIVVGAVIDTGQQVRAADLTTPREPTASGPQALAERVRVEAVLDAERRCVGPVDCSDARAAERLRAGAEDVAGWTPVARYQDSRRLLVDRLRARADLLETRAIAGADDELSTDDRLLLDAAASRWLEAASSELDARASAGIITDTEQARLEASLVEDPGA